MNDLVISRRLGRGLGHLAVLTQDNEGVISAECRLEYQTSLGNEGWMNRIALGFSKADLPRGAVVDILKPIRQDLERSTHPTLECVTTDGNKNELCAVILSATPLMEQVIPLSYRILLEYQIGRLAQGDDDLTYKVVFD